MIRKKEKGQLIVLSGPSGVGKSTVIAELLGQRNNIPFLRLLHHPAAPGGGAERSELQLRLPGGV